MNDDIKAINDRLKELNKEFRDLSALKKKIQDENKEQIFKEKYGDYKFLVKPTYNDEVDFVDMINSADLSIGTSSLGFLVAQYDTGAGHRQYHMARTEEEANNIRIIENLAQVEQNVVKHLKQDGTLSSEEILELYDNARNGQIQQTEDTEAVSE